MVFKESSGGIGTVEIIMLPEEMSHKRILKFHLYQQK